jgi:hypothetical protein
MRVPVCGMPINKGIRIRISYFAKYDVSSFKKGFLLGYS